MRFEGSGREPSRKWEVSAAVSCITMQSRLWMGLDGGTRIQGDKAGMTR